MAPGEGKKTATRTCTAQLTRLVGKLREIQFCRGERPWLLLDLTMAQLKAMMLIVQTGGVRSRELADGLGIAPSAATPLVDRLVDQKLARRDDDPVDRRLRRNDTRTGRLAGGLRYLRSRTRSALSSSRRTLS